MVSFRQPCVTAINCYFLGRNTSSARSRPCLLVVPWHPISGILMNLGTLVTIGNNRPSNLLHIVIDNGSYGSCSEEISMSDTANLNICVGWGVRDCSAMMAPAVISDIVYDAHLLVIPLKRLRARLVLTLHCTLNICGHLERDPTCGATLGAV